VLGTISAPASVRDRNASDSTRKRFLLRDEAMANEMATSTACEGDGQGVLEQGECGVVV
jgi:hypothetical protein